MMYYDDNYGFYNEEGEDPEEIRQFYMETQKASVWKKCSICGKRVKIKREYDKCNSCADQIERGFDFGY